MLKNCLDRNVVDFLPTFKFDPDWFVMSKMIKKLYDALFTDDDILFFDKDSGNVTFSNDEVGILSVNLNNINIDDANVYKYDPETIIHARLVVWYKRIKQHKAFQKDIMLVAWYPTRSLDWCMPQDEKNKIKSFFKW